MGKLEEKVTQYAGELEKMGVAVDHDLLMKVTKGCGPSIYNKDAEKVSSSDKAEMETVKKNFLMTKMGQTDSEKCDAAMQRCVDKFGSSNPNKYRAAFYYMLVKDLGLESKY